MKREIYQSQQIYKLENVNNNRMFDDSESEDDAEVKPKGMADREEDSEDDDRNPEIWKI
jgi:hypothetical protein